jgi:cold shock CspA family protein
MNGKVVEFDEHVGLGVIEDSEGTRLVFHCTAIADGSRTVKVGSPVRFDLVPGNRGQWEATNVDPDLRSSSRRGDARDRARR